MSKVQVKAGVTVRKMSPMVTKGQRSHTGVKDGLATVTRYVQSDCSKAQFAAFTSATNYRHFTTNV